MRIAALIPILLCIAACSSSSDRKPEGGAAAAQIDEDVLSKAELSQFVYAGAGLADSAVLARKGIESWATDVLLYREALAKLSEDEREVEKQVEEYRRSLVNYIYQTRLIEANLDTNVTREEIEEYYAANRANFILKDNIVKVNYFKIPLKAQGLDKMKRLFYATQQKDKEVLKSLCIQYAENFFLNDSTWLYLDDIKKEIPNLRDQAELVVSTGKVFEFSDEFYYYFLRIKDMKVKNTLSPMNFERQNIRNLVINQRKTLLLQEYKKQLLQKAKDEQRLKIF